LLFGAEPIAMAHPPASAPGDTRQSLVDEGGGVADGLECVSSAPSRPREGRDHAARAARLGSGHRARRRSCRDQGQAAPLPIHVSALRDVERVLPGTERTRGAGHRVRHRQGAVFASQPPQGADADERPADGCRPPAPVCAARPRTSKTSPKQPASPTEATSHVISEPDTASAPRPTATRRDADPNPTRPPRPAW
jgi:hypothetical protein